MRTAKVVLTLIALALSAAVQASTPTRPAAPVARAAADQGAQDNLHASAMKFLEAADARPRLELNLDKLLEEGKRSMLRPESGISQQFANEWVKRMKLRISLDEFVTAAAQAYEKYFTGPELDQLAQTQLAMKSGKTHTVSPELAQKVRSSSAIIQRDINAATSLIGARLGKEVGSQIQMEHPEWVKLAAPPPAAQK